MGKNFRKYLALKYVLMIGVFILITTISVKAETPEPVDFVKRTGFKGENWYQKQAVLWKGEIEQNFTNAVAWKHYYLATEYTFWGQSHRQAEKKAALESILSQMEKHVPESYQRYLLEYRFDNSRKDYLQKAHLLQPENPDPYYDLILQYELARNQEELLAYQQKLHQSRDISEGLLNYSFNMLMSTEKHGILFTNGDNDTYPAWLLQKVKKIRKNVTVLNVFVARAYPDYLKAVLKERNIEIDFTRLPDRFDPAFIHALCVQIAEKKPDLPIYFAVTVHPMMLKPFSDSLYNVGLAYRYSPTAFDNATQLRKNWENDFRKDYLRGNWYSTENNYAAVEKQLNGNYIALLMILMEYYEANNETEKVAVVRKLAVHIAEQSGKAAELADYFQRTKTAK